MSDLNSYSVQYKELPKYKILEILRLMLEKKNKPIPKIKTKIRIIY
jgi:hypothetical protein